MTFAGFGGEEIFKGSLSFCIAKKKERLVICNGFCLFCELIFGVLEEISVFYTLLKTKSLISIFLV